MKDSWGDPVICHGVPDDFDVSEVLLALLSKDSSVTGAVLGFAKGFPDLPSLGYRDLAAGMNPDRDRRLVILVLNRDVCDLWYFDAHEILTS